MLNITILEIDNKYTIRDNASGILSEAQDAQPSYMDIARFELSLSPDKMLTALIAGEV